MAKSTLKAKVRVRLGKTGSRAVRREGKIPAILYSKGMESIPLVVDPIDLKKALATDAGRNTLLDIEIESTDKKSKKSVNL